MPLTGVPSHDIPVERKAGKPEKQVVAIALNKERSMKGKDAENEHDTRGVQFMRDGGKFETAGNWEAARTSYLAAQIAFQKAGNQSGASDARTAREEMRRHMEHGVQDSVQWEPHEDDPVKDVEAIPTAQRPKPSRPVMSILNKEDLAKMTAKGGSKLHDVEPIEEGFEHSEHRQRKPQPWEDVQPVGCDERESTEKEKARISINRLKARMREIGSSPANEHLRKEKAELEKEITKLESRYSKMKDVQPVGDEAIKCWECGERFGQLDNGRYPTHQRADGKKCPMSGKKQQAEDAVDPKTEITKLRKQYERALQSGNRPLANNLSKQLSELMARIKDVLPV